MSGLELAQTIFKTISSMFDEIAILVIERERTMVKLWNTEPSVVQSWTETSIGLRLAKANRLWIMSFDVKDPLYVVKNAEEFVKLTDKIEESELYSPLPEPGRCSPINYAYDSNVVKYMDDPSRLVEAVVEGAFSSEIDRLAGTVTLSKVKRTLVTSRGFECSEETTSIETYARAFKGEFSGHWAHGSTQLSLDKITEVGKKAGELATITSKKVEITPGTYNVLISPLVAGNLFNYIAFMASAFSVMTGFSFFARYRPGDRIAPEYVSIYDKPRDMLLPHTRSFDDEGVETYDKPIVENGIVTTILHNSGTATKMGARHTGNAGWVRPVAWNIEISRGETGEKDLFSSLKEGVVITNNWYTRLQNYYEGTFSTVSRDVALYVKEGEIVGHIGRVRIATSFPNLLNNIIASSKETYDIWWWEVRTPTRTPWIMLKDTPVTKPEV